MHCSGFKTAITIPVFLLFFILNLNYKIVAVLQRPAKLCLSNTDDQHMFNYSVKLVGVWYLGKILCSTYGILSRNSPDSRPKQRDDFLWARAFLGLYWSLCSFLLYPVNTYIGLPTLSKQCTSDSE